MSTYGGLVMRCLQTISGDTMAGGMVIEEGQNASVGGHEDRRRAARRETSKAQHLSALGSRRCIIRSSSSSERSSSICDASSET